MTHICPQYCYLSLFWTKISSGVISLSVCIRVNTMQLHYLKLHVSYETAFGLANECACHLLSSSPDFLDKSMFQ